jgi:hypothetical protein
MQREFLRPDIAMFAFIIKLPDTIMDDINYSRSVRDISGCNLRYLTPK